jgi:hypothetical protein
MTPGRLEARDRVRRHVLEVLVLESRLAFDDRAAGKLAKAEEALEVACRDLVNAVDESLPLDRPKGWALGPGGVTA